MIKIKSYFSGWREVDRETAARFVQHLMAGILTMSDAAKEEYINTHRIQGATVAELLG